MNDNFDFKLFIEQRYDWSLKIFGTGRRTEGLIKHIIKELNEIKNKPDDLFEFIDVIFLALDLASRAGYTSDEIISAIIRKHGINILREWPKHSKDGEPIEHIREDGN